MLCAYGTSKPIKRFASSVKTKAAIGVAPDGRQMVTAGGDALRLWDLETDKAVRVFGEDQSGYWSVAFSRDGRQVVTGSNDHTARVWDLATGKEVQRFMGH